ncbi:MAG TPA: PAS domain S-box protein [Gemmatimonadaceae bacterium]|nr:PAS domain S-box protein [Gemmatimonadaceae bacterium]
MQRDRLRQLLDRTPDPAFALTARATVWSWNPAAEAVLGWSAGEAIERPIASLLDPRGPLGKGMDADYCERAIRGGGVPSFDIRVRTRAGGRLWLNVSVLVFEQTRTAPPLVVHLAHDITGSRERRELYERLTETARAIVQLVDDERHILPVSPLTEQEARILRAFAEGKSPAQVARGLGISTQTLRNHMHHVNLKLGTHNRLEAVTHAVRRHLI